MNKKKAVDLPIVINFALYSIGINLLEYNMLEKSGMDIKDSDSLQQLIWDREVVD